jgi:putative transposase
MGNHVHLLLTASNASGIAGLMEVTCANHAKFVNDTYEDATGESIRPSSLWEAGFEASPVQARQHLLACMRYIELNPVRAGLVAKPDAFRWSSYPSNALGHADDIVTPHPIYYALGRSAEERQFAYRQLVARRPLVAGVQR